MCTTRVDRRLTFVGPGGGVPFHCQNSALKDVESCAPCIAKWVRELSDEDAPGLVAPAPPTHTAALPDFSAVAGFAGKMAAAKLSGAIVADLFSDVFGLGAVDVTELSGADWQGLHPGRSSAH